MLTFVTYPANYQIFIFYMIFKQNYSAPDTWVEQEILEEYLLNVSSSGEDLVGEDDDPWLVGGEY